VDGFFEGEGLLLELETVAGRGGRDAEIKLGAGTFDELLLTMFTEPERLEAEVAGVGTL
jgi:hypothetical protein